MEITPESLSQQIPYYLTQEQKDGLVRALKDFPTNTQYYLNAFQDELLQGDGWTKLPVRNFETGERQTILGIILSNTCDVTPENISHLPAQIIFAPLIPLPAYITLLRNSGISPSQIESKIAAIKDQRVTTIFFLPASDRLQQDYIALLDQLYSMPARVFELEKEKSKIFTLSQIGFYLFLFKLSVHFCRFHEGVARL